jgi:hypothetical protein
MMRTNSLSTRWKAANSFASSVLISSLPEKMFCTQAVRDRAREFLSSTGHLEVEVLALHHDPHVADGAEPVQLGLPRRGVALKHLPHPHRVSARDRERGGDARRRRGSVA